MSYANAIRQAGIAGMPDAVMILTPEASVVQVVHWMQGATAVSSYDAAVALGRPNGDLLGLPDRVDEERQCCAAALEDGFSSYESVRHCKNGSLVHVDVSCKAIGGDGGFVRYLLTSQNDVTTLKVLRDAKLLEAESFIGMLKAFLS